MMDTKSDADRRKARIQLVEEHIRRENLHDLDGILATFGPAARYDDEPWSDHRSGPDEVRRYYQDLLNAAPDLQIEVWERYVTDEAIVVEVTISGTHTGTWRGLPPTGRRLKFPLCGIYTFDEGDKLRGERIYYDRATVLKQLGVFREPASLAGRLSMAINHPLTIVAALVRKMFGR